MSFLECSKCQKNISFKDTTCPHCSHTIVLWREIKISIEKSRLRLALLAVLAIFLLAAAWIIRTNTGAKWPLYAIVLLLAPLVPWILQLAYKSAAPPDDEEHTYEDAHSTTDKEKPMQHGVDPIKGKVLEGPLKNIHQQHKQ